MPPESATPLRFHWFLPTNGDGRDIVGGGHGVATASAGAVRPASLGYLGQIARAAEQLGFEGALTPTGTDQRPRRDHGARGTGGAGAE